MPKKKGDKKRRSIAKAATWRITATLTTTILVLIFTGSLTMAVTVGFFEFILKMFIYYLHERIWNKIPWAK